MINRRSILLLLLLILSACQPAPAPNTGLDEPFTLTGGQETTLAETDLTLKFEAVPEDSRCPTNVECFWTGQARILLLAQQGDQEPLELEFNTNPAPGQTIDKLTINGYTIQLQDVSPYPQEPDPPIPFKDYQITLTVTGA